MEKNDLGVGVVGCLRVLCLWYSQDGRENSREEEESRVGTENKREKNKKELLVIFVLIFFSSSLPHPVYRTCVAKIPDPSQFNLFL